MSCADASYSRKSSNKLSRDEWGQLDDLLAKHTGGDGYYQILEQIQSMIWNSGIISTQDAEYFGSTIPKALEILDDLLYNVWQDPQYWESAKKHSSEWKEYALKWVQQKTPSRNKHSNRSK